MRATEHRSPQGATTEKEAYCLPEKAAKFAKAQLSPYQQVSEGSNDRRQDLFGYYLPHLSDLTDHELIKELKYWKEKVGKRFPYPQGSAPAVFIDEVIRSGVKFCDHPTRIKLRKACAALRGVLVPRFRVKARIAFCLDTDDPRHVGFYQGSDVDLLLRLSLLGQTRSFSEDEAKFVKLNLRRLRRKGWGKFSFRAKHRVEAELLLVGSDWRLVQVLATLVGSCRFNEGELSFVADVWSRASRDGLQHFQFRASGERDKARRIFGRVAFRDVIFVPEDIAKFKKQVGLDQVSLWNPEPRQLELYNPKKEVESEPDALQLDLLASVD